MPVTAGSSMRHAAGPPASPVLGPSPDLPAFDQGSPWVRIGRRLRSARPRTLWLNGALAVLVVVGVVIAVLTVGRSDTPTVTSRTTTVARGSVSSTVTGSGNAASSLSTSVNFVTNGTVTSIAVKAGDRVRLGQTLATIDATGAKQALRTAQAQLDTARAQYQQAVSGPTAVQRQKDQLAVTQAQQGVTSAQNGVANAQTQLQLDTTSLANAVNNAHAQLDGDTTQLNTGVSNAQAQLSNDTTVQNTNVSNAQTAKNTACSGTTTVTATPSPSSSTGTTTTTTTSNSSSTACQNADQALTQAQQARTTALLKDQQAITTAENNRDATLTKDQQAITTAEQNRTATLIKDNQAIVSARAQVTTAQGQVTSARLNATADLTPSTPAQVQQARASVTTAQIQVDQARLTLTSTKLTAPQAGVVMAVNGKLGQSSSATTSSTSSSSSGTGSSSGTSSSSSSGSSSGFVVLANVSQLAVTANIAEADVANIKLGQQAGVTFSATNTRADGTVTQVSPLSTTSNNVVMYPVTVSLTSVPEGVKVGATASLSISTGSVQDVLVVPSSAVTTLGTRHTVTVRRNGVDTVTPVEIGLVGDTGTEVTSGVSEGDVLVLPTTTSGSGSGSSGGGLPRLGTGLGGGGR